MKAIIVKAEALYSICNFEHGLVLFIRGQYLASDSIVVQNGILKCKKTISNKIGDDDVFFFSGSKYFFDHLRREGEGAVDKYINGVDQSFRAVSSLAAIKKKCIKEKVKKDKDDKKPVNRKDRMKADKMFLKNLEKSMLPLSGMEKDLCK